MSTTESGEIVLTPTIVNNLRKTLCTWVNLINPAVMFEVTTLTANLPSTAAGIAEMHTRLTAAHEKWGPTAEAPEQKLLINRLAIAATAAHVADCQNSSGRMRAVTPHVLDDLLPKRNTKDIFFRVPDIHGNLPAGITLDHDALGWQANSTANAAASEARNAPLARIAFTEVDKLKVSAFGGGEIIDQEGNVVLRFG